MAHQPEIFLIWGAGGHGKVVADLVRSLGHTVLGYVDGDPAKLGFVAEPGGTKVIMTEGDFVPQCKDDRPLMPGAATAVAIAIGANQARLLAADRVPHDLMPPLAHPSAVVSASATLGAATVVFPNAVVNAAARIGRAVIVNSAAVVEHDCVVGDGVHIAPGAIVLGGANVHDLAWLGAGSVVLPEVRVGFRAVVGAGAVVTRDVPDGATVVGNPARAFDQARSTPTK